MSDNTLAVKFTADVIDLQAKSAVAKAELSGITSELNKLAKESAKGIIDEAGEARLRSLAEDLLKAKSAAAELSEQMRQSHEDAAGFGETLEEIRGKFSTAFEATGIAVVAEGIMKVGEEIEKLGERAIEIRSYSEILGVTTDQFQAMQHASEEAGVSTEVLARSAERLTVLLLNAREGSAAAVEKLHALGVTNDQIADSGFKVNELLQVLHDRLENSATSQQTMNQLIKEFGPRAALAAVAIKEYDGSIEGIQRAMDRLNGLTTEQIDKVAEGKKAWSEFAQQVSNAWFKTVAAISSAMPTTTGTSWAAKRAEEDERAEGEEARARQELQQSMLKQEMENVKAGVEAFKQGTLRRLEALQEYARLAEQYYGSSSVDAVVKANQAVIAAEREYKQARESQIQELSDFALSLEAKVTAEHARDLEQQRRADERNTKERERQIQELSDYAQELDTRVTREHAKALKEMEQFDSQQTKEMKARWQDVARTIESSLTSSFQGILRGTQTFSGAINSLFMAMVDGIIASLVKMAVQWAENLLLQKVLGKTTAASQISANAGVAATAAMASVAAIPFYGWAMAPEVGAATFAEAEGYNAALSAAGGYDIPAGVNPVVQTHEREMILPQKYGDVIRNMADSGGGSSARIEFIPVGSDHGLVRVKDLAAQLNNVLRRNGQRAVFQ
jgi:hypothetical protein